LQQNINYKLLILLLALLSAIGPFSVDTYIPSMPIIANEFNVEIDKIEHSLSLFLVGMCIGLFSGGILSDRVGRKKTSLLGLAGFSISSFMIFFTTSVDSLYLYRFIEAIFAGIIVINSPATVRDLFNGKEAARVFSFISTISMLAPILAPIVGSTIIHFVDWRYIFLFLSLYGVVVFIFIYFKLPETYTYHKRSIVESYLSVVTHKVAIWYILALSITFSGMFVFITKSAFIYIDYFGVDTDYFPLFFGADVALIILFARYNIKLINKYKVVSIVKVGISIQFLSAFLLLFFSIEPSIVSTFILLTINVSMMGLIFGNLNSLTLEYFGKNSGVASAVIGILNFGLASIVSFSVSLFHTPNFLPISISLVITSTLAFLFVSKNRD
jgi:DHA1 family bicyclomycin/chloramphenicol resistance-like MFS transporter